MSPLYLLSLSLLSACAVLSFWRGGAWERTTAALLVLVWIGSTLTPFDGVSPAWPVIALDAAMMLVLIYGAVFSGRSWMIWAAAFQILLMATHLAFIRFHVIQQWAYITSLYLWGDLGLLALAVGAVTRKHGVNTPASAQDDKDARR